MKACNFLILPAQLLLLSASTLPSFADGPVPVAGRAEAPVAGPTSPQDQVLMPDGSVPDAMKAAMPQKRKGPVRRFVHGLGKELGTEFGDMGKDMVLLFSAQDIDPYEKEVDKTKPYELMQIVWVDGSEASLIRYPDGSLKVVGGFSDGTVIVPRGQGEYTVLYPNGVRGKMEKLSEGTWKIYRPDHTITSITKTMSGALSISNDKSGYMGTATPDTTGLRYEFATGSY